MFEHLKALECSWVDEENFVFIYDWCLVGLVPVGLNESTKDQKFGFFEAQ